MLLPCSPPFHASAQALLEQVAASSAAAPRLTRAQRKAVVHAPLTQHGEAALLQRLRFRLDRCGGAAAVVVAS
jgi:hypothetical protein